MGSMLQYEGIINLIEVYIKQLEGLAYTKNAALAVRLQGAIECGIRVCGCSADIWTRRINAAMTEVMKERDLTEPLKNVGLPEEIAKAVTLPTSQVPKSNQVLPTI